MTPLDKARQAMRRVDRIIGQSQVHTTPGRQDGRDILTFDGVLIEPCNLMILKEYIDIVKEYLDHE